MTTDDPVITQLADANPVSGEASSDPGDRAEAERIMQRVLAGDPAPRPRRRRRGLLAPALSVVVVLAVAAVVLRAGSSSHTSPASGGSLRIVLAAEPTPQTPKITSSAMTREAALIRQRLRSILPHFSVTRAGDTGLVITGPGASAADRSRIIRLATTLAQLSFYDWEANVVAPNGKTAAQDLAAHDTSVMTLSQGTNGGPGQPGAGSLSLYDAVTLAAKQPSRPSSRFQARMGPEYYMFGAPGSAACAAAARAVPTPGVHCLLAGPVSRATRQQAIDALAAQLPAGVSASSGKVLTVPQGTRVLQAVGPSGVSFTSPSAQFFAVRDDVAMTGHDIASPRRSPDPSGQPAVSFGLTAAGERAFQAVTGELARRGAADSSPGQTLNQHFAIVLDNRLLTAPSIDFRQYPDGIRTPRADIAGGFTPQSAADLATELRYGALPLALSVVQ
jgi:preprotein translocase subunit SecD